MVLTHVDLIEKLLHYNRECSLPHQPSICPPQHLTSHQLWSGRRKRRTIRNIFSLAPRWFLSPTLQILWMRSHFPNHPAFNLCWTRFPYPPHLAASAHQINPTIVWAIPISPISQHLPMLVSPTVHLVREQWPTTSLSSCVGSPFRGREVILCLGAGVTRVVACCGSNEVGHLFSIRGEDRSPGTGDEVPTPQVR